MSSAGTSTQDVTGVFDDSYNQLFVNARALRVLIRDSSELMKQPLETGATIVDHQIFLPISAEFQVVLNPEDFADTYQEIKTAYKAGTKMNVQTSVDSYADMVIQEIPYDISSDIADTIAVGMKMEQAVFVDPQYAQLPPSSVAKSSNSSTANTGQKQGSTATGTQQSAAYSLIFGSGK